MGPSRYRSTNATMLCSSSSRFSSGVPLSTIAYWLCSSFTVWAVRVFQFLIRCASSRMIRSGPHAAMAAASRWIVS
jgi:hypothetical protein